MSLAGKIIAFVTKRSAQRIEAATKNAVQVQTDLLLGIVSKNAGTEYGQRYGFSKIDSIKEYQRQLPVITYEDIKQDMDRVLSGEKNIFTAEDPVMFAQTSGTTGDPKYIPVTPTDQRGAHKDPTRTWLYHAQKDHPGILDHKLVSLVSPAVEGYAPSGLPFGSTSGHMYKNMPGIIRRAYSIPYDVFEIADYQSKYYAIMRVALEDDVRFLATANPSSVLKLCEKADEYSEDLIRDIRDGTLSKNFEIEPHIRAELEKRFKPDSGRAAALDKARGRRGGVLKPADYWPNIALIGCWKGGTVGHYVEKFTQWFDFDGRRSVPIRDWGYLSSEARGSIPLSDEGSKGVITVASNFFEFVEVDDLESRRDDPGSWGFLTVGEIEEGKQYYIFVTTTSGLYRYDINDVIEVAGHYNATPEIVFLRKGRGMTNITGEKVSVNQIIGAYDSAFKATGAVPDHFKAEADLEASRYVFRVEFAGKPNQQTQEAFLRELDRHLKDINIEYKAKRDSSRLKAPVLHVMREGWYERGRRKQVASGKRAFQAKTELLSPVKAETKVVLPEIEHMVELPD